MDFGLVAAQRGSLPAAMTCQHLVDDEDSAHAGVMSQQSSVRRKGRTGKIRPAGRTNARWKKAEIKRREPVGPAAVMSTSSRCEEASSDF